MSISNPYHEGELAVQQRVSEIEMARLNSGAIDHTILAGALRFIEQQPMVVIGSIDPEGAVWASTLLGNPGFLRALDNQTLELDLSQPRSAKDDPLWSNLNKNQNVGLLLIELGSRRRIRINGRVRTVSDTHTVIDVERAYPNCPKYIQRRDWKTLPPDAQSNTTPSTRGKTLNHAQKSLIAGADTLFVASAHPEHGVDASHRGGHPGFVQLINDRQLRIPDFAGNSMFNTLGNFVSYPHAGVVFIDFERGRLLQLTGRPKILWDLDDPQGETGGTRRYWQFDIEGWLESALPFRLSWELLDYSPFIPELRRESPATGTLSLRVERIRRESEQIRSFRMRATDGGALPEFQPGAHIQVKVQLPDGSHAERHYSLLSDPDERAFYEIGVLAKPDGRGGSLYLHEQIQEGDVIESRVPKNEFPLAGNANHSILIAGGIGITPILSMLRRLASARQSFEMHYSARTYSELAFRDTIEQVAGDRVHFYASRDPLGQHLELQHLLSLPEPGVHVYICGPRRMISAVRETAEALGWPSAQIHFESFGAQPLADDRPIRVHLAKSNLTLNVPAEHTILDTLLDAGVNVPHDCKRGDCTLCATRVLGGEPDHRDLCLNSAERASSMCVCVSRARGDELTLDL
ncbi:pyridoxamine 5'-phosphate oxidase family protein [Sedimenticola sp.]|uniref:pyridoxamine 5'-phosphate oxidase family protein n=1 Tax=Sedimenticola sp. TaxID=1940285 RepID=UPI00258B05ED|nr:pyridoxamine 5'-phosphate oxidase family protein [Sedimenticola sp.]MCW8905559.1 pyridoxamine 5'-phosphate oxidase family protein [Sedimenticola sp.]